METVGLGVDEVVKHEDDLAGYDFDVVGDETSLELGVGCVDEVESLTH